MNIKTFSSFGNKTQRESDTIRMFLNEILTGFNLIGMKYQR